MCTAYEIGKRGGSIPDALKADAAAELLGLGATMLVRPTHQAPVILADGSLATMRWGFRREMKGKVPGKTVTRTIVNSREDKLTGHLWRESFERRRCLIPAASFFEWVVRGTRNVPLRFHHPDHTWLWIAGIWEDHPQLGACYSMITTVPSGDVAPVHDRMPAVLDHPRIGPFLGGDLVSLGPSPVPLVFEEAANFLKPADRSPPAPPPSQGELF
jgi:putative SOS response-associated peptidase YedK